MALVFKFDDAQLERLIGSIDNLSANLAKWQGEETKAIKEGFRDLSGVLSGVNEEEQQAIIDQLTAAVKAVKVKLKTSVDTQTKGE